MLLGASVALTPILAGCSQSNQDRARTASFNDEVISWTFDYWRAENSRGVSSDPTVSCTSDPKSVVFSGKIGGVDRDEEIGIVSSEQSDEKITITIGGPTSDSAGEGQVEIYYNYAGAILFRDEIPQRIEVHESEPETVRTTTIQDSDC